MRIVLMCGKGGVGKSTLAAAIARRSAQAGARTLLFSVDPAHSLAPVLGQPIGGAMVQVAENFWATELEAVDGLSAQWAEGKAYVETLLKSQGVEHPLGGELAMLPGVEEAAALTRLKAFAESGQFDAIVLDNAPTGFALRLLALPEIAIWYAKHARRLFDRYGSQLMLLLPMLGGSVPLPHPTALSGSLNTLEQLEALPRMMGDPAITTAKVVMTPDQLGLAEARELYKWLSIYGVTVDELLVNQVLPDAVQDPFFAGQKAREAAIIDEATTSFAPLPVRVIARQGDELAGLAAIEAFGSKVWPTGDPLAPRTTDRAVRIEAREGEVLVTIKLPFVPREAVDLAKFENELYITIGQHRRILLLPAETASMQPVKAKFSEGKLLVTLAGN